VRYRALLLGLVLLAAGCGHGKEGNMSTAAAPQPPAGKVSVIIKGPTTHPKANARWPYSVTVRDSSGDLVSGKLTVQIVDPVGNAHTVTYDNTKKPVKNFPFRGTFRDYLEFPKQSIGFPLTVRVPVTTPKGNGLGTFGVKPR
jgi:hypothetical protein